MRTGKSNQQIAMIATRLNEGKSVFVAGIKNPKDYIERLFKTFGIVVITEPHYITKNTEIVLEENRIWRTEYEPQLTGFNFCKNEK